MDKWLNDWWNIYKLIKQLELLDIQGYRLYCNFIQAIKPIFFSFVGVLKVNLIYKEQKNKDALSIINLIEEFKEYYYIQQVSLTIITTANYFVFTTFQNNINSNTNSNLIWHKKYICGFIY